MNTKETDNKQSATPKAKPEKKSKSVPEPVKPACAAPTSSSGAKGPTPKPDVSAKSTSSSSFNHSAEKKSSRFLAKPKILYVDDSVGHTYILYLDMQV